MAVTSVGLGKSESGYSRLMMPGELFQLRYFCMNLGLMHSPRGVAVQSVIRPLSPESFDSVVVADDDKDEDQS